MSFVWKYFDKLDLIKARCKVNNCRTEIAFHKGTSNLIGHLKLKAIHNISHNIIEKSSKRLANDEISETQMNQKTLFEYCNERTVEEEVARMICESNLSFNQIAHTYKKTPILLRKSSNTLIVMGFVALI